MRRLDLSISPLTTRITRDEAEEWFRYLKLYTEIYLSKHFPWSFKRYYPIRARLEGGAQREPKFIVNHHTSNIHGKFGPALNRFFGAKKASSNFLIGRGRDELLYLVDIHDMAYHAFKKTFIPINIMKMLDIERSWVNEPGIEVAGNGSVLLFSYEQLLNVICLQRFLVAYYPSIMAVKSHRFFSKVSRAGDPGPFYLLPLVEHAVFNNVNVYSDSYWLEKYRKDPVSFMNNSREVIDSYGLKSKDEWYNLRKHNMASLKNLKNRRY